MMNSLKCPVFPTLMLFYFALLFSMFGYAHASPVYPLIQEVYYDHPGADGNKVFTEIYGPPGISLDNYYLKGINGYDEDVYNTVDLSGAVLPSNGLLVVAGSGFTTLPAGSYFVGDVDWQNGPDAVQLWYDAGSLPLLDMMHSHMVVCPIWERGTQHWMPRQDKVCPAF